MSTTIRAPSQLRWVVAALSSVSFTVGVLAAAVVPVLGTIAEQMDVSMASVSWIVTINLLVAAAATPLIGRLTDVLNQKHVLVGVLVLVVVGSVLASVTSSLPVLIVARALQSMSFGMHPVCVALLRDRVPPERVARALGIASASVGLGGAAGIALSGLLMNGSDNYHRVFWLTAVCSGVALTVVTLVIPSQSGSVSGTIDWWGAAGLAVGLSLLLLMISKGGTWGWFSVRTVGTALGGSATLVAWWFWERGVRQPLVSTQMLVRRVVLTTNVATLLVGMGMYFEFLGLTQLVTADRDVVGYGFGASILEASLVYLFPGALGGFVAAGASGRLIDRFGARVVLVSGALSGMIGFLWLGVSHDQTWHVVVAGILINIYVSMAYGALPMLLVGEVGSAETGVATGMNAIARMVGGAVAAAGIAALLAHSSRGSGQPSEGAFEGIFFAGAVTAVLAMVLVIASHASRRQSASTEAYAVSRAATQEWT